MTEAAHAFHSRLPSAIFATVLLLACVVAGAQSSINLETGWQLASACKVQAAGAQLSTQGYSPDEQWIATSVPSTVLAAQVKAGLQPDPYFGDNLRHIPGTSYSVGHNFSNLPMPEDSPYHCGWWYRRSFTSPKHEASGRVWIHFGGINYRGELWLNGKLVADSSKIAGAYRTYDFDITSFLNKDAENVLAVETFAPTEKQLGINWVDWNPCPPDKDMGLWGDVSLSSSGPVTLRSPMAVTHLPGGSTDLADVTLFVELHNALDQPVTGRVRAKLNGIQVEQSVQLAPHEDRTISFTPAAYGVLHIKAPELWWPEQMGQPHLEQLHMEFVTADGISDEKTVAVGLREITSELTSNGSRLFRVNSKPILIRGAGWSQDMLLRSNTKNIEEQLRMVRDMHLNTIRLEGKLETEEFFRMADEQGILVMLGWCCCDHWEHWSEWSSGDLDVATASLRAQLLRLRQHASLLVWLNGSDNAPPPDVERAYLKVETDVHWPNPILAAASQQTTPGGGADGVKMTGPYDYVAPSYWYVDKLYGGAHGFNTETSPGPAIPSRASRARFLPDPDAWPPSEDWSLHNGGGEFAHLSVFNQAMESVYGKPNSAADYERIASTMEYDSERAMFESYSRNKYDATGVVQWMLNNAWPSMIWHLYDYYLDAGSGYFATRKACEPLHVQYSYDDLSVAVVNSTYHQADDLTVDTSVYNTAWQPLFHETRSVVAAADSSQSVTTIPEALYQSANRILFIDLKLRDKTGAVVSRNFYWVPTTLTSFDWAHTDYTHTPALRDEDLTSLKNLPQAHVVAAAVESSRDGKRILTLRLRNDPTMLAFQVRAAVRTVSGDLVAPVYWQDNWIELEPGEETLITAELPDDAPNSVVVDLDGWNLAAQRLTPVK